jgi:DNA repair protein RecN (Recombination protein N)
MLIEIRIENFAVIERLSVRLEPGLNVLTGETGAGKSIIVGALGLLLGERASDDVVRTGATRAVVEGVFDVAGRERVLGRLDEHGIAAEDGLLILRREVSLGGRNRAWVNGSAATASLVGELGRELVDLHGQHEHQTLLRQEEQRLILDAFEDAAALREEVAAAHRDLREAADALAELERRRRDTEQRADYLRFQVGEIEAAGVAAGEEERLEEEARRLHHADDLARLAARLHQELYAAEDAVSARLGELRRVLDQLARIDPSVDDAREPLDTAFYALEDLGRRMGDYAAGIEHDPSRLEEIRTRQDLLFRLRSKYGPTLEDVVEAGARARRELESLDAAGFERRALEKRLGEAEARYEERAAALTGLRTRGGGRLEEEVAALLPEVGLRSGRFQVGLVPLPVGGPAGRETVEFRVSLNPGFDLRPLSRIASGGELSRIMLALKTILARADRVPTLVFDEIDAGIGGRVALQIGVRLKAVAAEHQVFVITHLPQIASRADQHLRVEKLEQEGTTLTRLVEVRGEDRVRELARMLGGDAAGSAGLQHARELLASAGAAAS